MKDKRLDYSKLPIDKDIEIPSRKRNSTVVPLCKAMKVGDSVFFYS